MKSNPPTLAVVRIVAIAIAAAGLAALVVLALQPLLVIFSGILFALVLRGLSSFASRKTKLPYGICLVTLLSLIVGAIAIGVVTAGPTLRDQVGELATRLPETVKEVLARVRQHPATQALGKPSPGGGPDAEAVAKGALTAVFTTLDVLGAIIVFLFVGVYSAARPKDYVRAVMLTTPRPYRLRVRRVMHEIAHNLTRWLIGRLVAMLFVGITCAIAFTLLKVPLALTLAILAGLLTFVEYVGAVVSAIPPILLAFTESPKAALGVLIVFSVLHVIEGYVLTPLLARASVRLPPAITLAGQVVFAAVVGPLGLTFSTPLLIVGVSTVQSLRGRARRRDARERAGRTEHGRAGAVRASGAAV